jgi:peptidoglycan/LPS O-acetylase OafA/YrhL
MRFLHLDTLRFALAFFVVYGHTLGFNGPARNGGLAVDFFFILSGFVLTHSITKQPRDFYSFAIARFARLWPLQLVAVIAVLLLASWPGWQALQVNLTLTQNAGIIDELTMNIPSWSISAEFIIGLFVLYPLARYGLWPAAITTIIVGYVLLNGISAPLDQMHIQPVGPISAGLVRCAVDTCLGYFAYQARPMGRLIPKQVMMLLHIIAIIGIFGWMAAPIGNHGKAVAVVFSAFAIWALSVGESTVQRVLASRKIAWLGSLSFGIYMWHFPVLLLFRNYNLIGYTEDTRAAVLSLDGRAISTLALLYFSILVVAAISYIVVEKPSKRAILSLATPKRAATRTATS